MLAHHLLLLELIIGGREHLVRHVGHEVLANARRVRRGVERGRGRNGHGRSGARRERGRRGPRLLPKLLVHERAEGEGLGFALWRRRRLLLALRGHRARDEKELDVAAPDELLVALHGLAGVVVRAKVALALAARPAVSLEQKVDLERADRAEEGDDARLARVVREAAHFDPVEPAEGARVRVGRDLSRFGIWRARVVVVFVVVEVVVEVVVGEGLRRRMRGGGESVAVVVLADVGRAVWLADRHEGHWWWWRRRWAMVKVGRVARGWLLLWRSLG